MIPQQIKQFWGLKKWHDYLALPFRIIIYGTILLGLAGFVLFFGAMNKLLGDD